MPYCVNCGVKLSPQIKNCPLCGVEVLHPGQPVPPVFPASQPLREQIPQDTFDKHLWINLISVILVAPAAITVVIDWIFGGEISWSRYVAASLIVVWVWCVSPFLFSRNIVPLWITLDAAALLGFLYYVERISSLKSWFLGLALPITIGLTSLLLALIFLIRRNILRQLHKAAALFFAVGTFSLFLEFFIDRYVDNQYHPGWSLLIFISCTAFTLIAIVLQRRKYIVEEIKFWLRM